jgi:hypothetical protein
MLTGGSMYKLNETLAVCDLHYQRMMYAYESLSKSFPVTEYILSQLSPIDLALFDQLIYQSPPYQRGWRSRGIFSC